MYSDELNVQVLIALLKAHGIRNVVASPGGTNVSFVGSLQQDRFFRLFSAVDERHGAYMACGIAFETGCPVVLSCTGATASRNYMPALTEAFYRKLPILVVTSSQVNSRVGQLHAQVTDRSILPNDVARCSMLVPPVRNKQDQVVAERLINTAILETQRQGGGPAHINLETEYVQSFAATSLPSVNRISRIDSTFDESPLMPKGAKVAIWIGAHRKFSKGQSESLSRFVRTHDAVVLCDHTSAYYGPNKVVSAIAGSQTGLREESGLVPDVIVHIGEVTGDYSTNGYLVDRAEVWRVSPDGEVRDPFSRLRYVFEMPEEVFFSHYAGDVEVNPDYYSRWQMYVNGIRNQVPPLPFSNSWIAQQLSSKIPQGSIIHFAILNSLRSWNNFDLPDSVSSSCNVGGFGIDGCTSALIGAAVSAPDRIAFLITGDLAFFYDLNAIGNRHIGKNVRILLVNNGTGGEFYRFDKVRNELGDSFAEYIPAAGHFGNQSRQYVRHMATDLGFEYLSAGDADEFAANIEHFCRSSERPIIFECFTSPEDDVRAIKLISSIDQRIPLQGKIASVIPRPAKALIKKVIGRL